MDVLVVEPNRTASNQMLKMLSDAGFAPALARDYRDARDRLKNDNFSAVITAQRLGAYNGLQLAIWAAFRGFDAIVTTPDADPVLDREAANVGATTVVDPCHHPETLLAALHRKHAGDVMTAPLAS